MTTTKLVKRLRKAFKLYPIIDDSPVELFNNAADRIDNLEEVLKKIVAWEQPPSGQFWDKEKTQPMSYETAFGSVGIRNYFRQMAQEALNG